MVLFKQSLQLFAEEAFVDHGYYRLPLYQVIAVCSFVQFIT